MAPGPVTDGAPTPRRPAWRRWGVDLAFFAVAVVAVGAWQTRHHASGVAPDFALAPLHGGEAVSRASLAGKPVLLLFWAPWCGVCKAEARNVEWARAVVGDRAEVVSVAQGYRSPAEVEQYVREQGVGGRVLLGTEATEAAYRLEAFPTAYFLDADGTIKHSAVGYTTTLGFVLRLLL